MGVHADPSRDKRCPDETWLVLEAKRRMGILRHASRRRVSLHRGVPGQARCGSGSTFVPRPRPATRGSVTSSEACYEAHPLGEFSARPQVLTSRVLAPATSHLIRHPG